MLEVSFRVWKIGEVCGRENFAKPLVFCTKPYLYLQDDRPIVRLLHYFEAHLIQLLCRVVVFPP